MCHLVLLFPVFGLVVFWLWPMSTAVPVYSVILVVSVLMYRAIFHAMRRAAVTGREGMLHRIGEVTSAGNGGWSVLIRGERWRARSSDVLRPRDRVEVVGIEGLTLRVQKLQGTGPAAPSNAGTAS